MGQLGINRTDQQALLLNGRSPTTDAKKAKISKHCTDLALRQSNLTCLFTDGWVGA